MNSKQIARFIGMLPKRFHYKKLSILVDLKEFEEIEAYEQLRDFCVRLQELKEKQVYEYLEVFGPSKS